MSRPAVLLCLVLLAGCASDGAGQGSAPTWHEQGDRLLQAGDFQGAARAYERHLADAPGSPVVEEKLKTAHGRAAHALAAQALAAADNGDAERADALLVRAEQRAPWSAAVRRTRTEIGGRLSDARRTAELRNEAEALLRSDPEGAMDRLADARRLDPADPDLVRLLREATMRTDAELSARRAVAAWNRGDRAAALRELPHASYAGRGVTAAEVLLERIGRDLQTEAEAGSLQAKREARELGVAAGVSVERRRALRDLLADALAADAGRLLEDGRPATAALLEIELRRLGVDTDTPALDSVAESARIEVLVLPFDDETGGDVDGLRLARSIVERLRADAAGGGLALTAVLADEAVQRAARPRALRLTGRVTTIRIGEGPRSRSRTMVRVQTGVREQANPAATEAAADLDRIELELAAAQRELEDSKDLVRELLGQPVLPGPGGRNSERSRLRLAIARARAREGRAQRRHDEIVTEAQTARTRVATTPTRIEVPVWEDRPRPIVAFRKAATLTATIRLTDGDDVLLDAPVTGSAAHDEVIADAFPAGDLAADPDETPDDAAMARSAADHFARLAAGQVRSAAASAARHLLEAARAAERAGRASEAAEAYAMYLLVTPEVSSPQRADAARALRELSGVHAAVRTGDARRER